jgi:S1-C subfamily serine protease
MVGDTIVAIDGQDLRGQVVSFASLLRPGSMLAATVRRDGDTHAVKMKIAPRPAQAENRCVEVNSAIAAAMANPVVDVIRLGGGGFEYEYTTPTTPRPRTAPRTPQPGSTPEAVVAPMPPQLLVSSGGMPRVLAGAVIVLTEPEVLRDMMGAPNGVWVSRVAHGSPAYQSGLRAGDVIVKANGEKIISPLGLQKAIAEADDRDALKLSVVRKKKPLTIVLRWSENRD